MNVTTLVLDGELFAGDLRAIGAELFRLASRRRLAVVLDFSAVTHFHFRGASALAARAKLFRSGGGDIKIAGASPYLQALLRAGGAHDAFDHHPDAAAARAAFDRSAQRRTA